MFFVSSKLIMSLVLSVRKGEVASAEEFICYNKQESAACNASVYGVGGVFCRVYPRVVTSHTSGLKPLEIPTFPTPYVQGAGYAPNAWQQIYLESKKAKHFIYKTEILTLRRLGFVLQLQRRPCWYEVITDTSGLLSLESLATQGVG